MQKFVSLMLCAVLSVLLLISSASAADPTGLTVSDCSFSPAVLMPGDTGIFTITLNNSGEETAVLNRAYIKVYDSEGMEMTTAESYNLPRYIAPGSTVTLTMPIQAGEETGIFYPVFNLAFADHTTSLKQPIPVIVDDSGLDISLTQVPDSFPESGSEQVVLTLANPMQTDLTAVSLSADGKGVSCKEGTVFVGTISSGSSAVSALTVRTDKAEEVNLVVSYTNGANKHTETVTIPAGVSASAAAPELIITNILVEKTGKYHTLTADVNNAGFTTANSLRITSLEGGDIGPYSTYVVGSLDGDDLAGFELTFTEPENGVLTLVLTYKNDGGDSTTEEVSVVLENHMKPKETNSVPLIVGGIIILLVAAAVIVRKKKAGKSE